MLLGEEAFYSYVIAELQLPMEAYGVAALDAPLFLDSLSSYELIVLIEDLTNCAEPPFELPAIDTLRSAYRYYLRLGGSPA